MHSIPLNIVISLFIRSTHMCTVHADEIISAWPQVWSSWNFSQTPSRNYRCGGPIRYKFGDPGP